MTSDNRDNPDDLPPDTTPPDGARGKVPTLLTAHIARRDALAMRWAEAMAHGGPAGDLLVKLLDQEALIERHWPDFWRAFAAFWADYDAGLIHTEASPRRSCPTCLLQASNDERRDAA